ncbi:sarcosine oxidase subunit alpha family protein [Sphingomonas bacterium]|uniref:sarcosine oxidase subunit alpha family protein n=1 Tax=Sphingomonas bacterium TaxID=1895847 RepID=UPI001575A559|nr:sarcosine oxidase subunit alpha family protein [Sphingomonas bacterium]
MSRRAAGGLIDRSKPLAFTFDGRSHTGFEGDTLASALVADDVRLIARSFKYHRPRGILTAGSEEPNALVTLRSGARAEPNTRATTTALFAGLEAFSQNRWPNLRFDVMAVNQLFAPIFAAGFYYKTFMWPAAFWERVYEPVIRRAAGLGQLSMLPDPDRYDREHAFCDLLVIGGGPAGLAAALTTARAGLRVILVDEDVRPGGRLLAERHEIDGMPGAVWADAAAVELAALPNVRVLTRTAVFGVYDGREYAAVERVTDHLVQAPAGQPRQRLWKIVAKRAILATGATERPLVFGGNDRPGVMIASAVSTYINRFAALPGRRAVVFTASDSGWQTALDLADAGVHVAAVVDPREAAPVVADALRKAGTEILLGAQLQDAIGAPVRKVEVRLADGRLRRIACDLVAMAGGWNPAIGLGSNMGARPVWSEAAQAFLLDQTPPGLAPAGAAAGHFAIHAALHDGVAQAVAATDALGKSALAHRFAASDEPIGVRPLWHVAGRGKAFVDFQHDVTDKDVALAAREGFVSIEHLKRYTTLGMATDQGRTSQLNGHALLAAATGRSIAETGTILSRAPYQPVAIGVLAGHHREEHFRPERRTASHDWAVGRGASFVDAGQWKRAQWFARPGEDWLATVNREVTATRNGVGICDVSTLGKIDVHGPDAAVLLDRLYVNMFSTLPVGRARYGVMLREDGFVMDDGTTTRLAEDHFFVTTTTVNAARVMQHIDYARQVLWPELDVQATSVTEQWSTYAVAGPQSRALLQQALPGIDISNDAFPFMAAAGFRWNGQPARIFRLSFSGELAYEVSVPARQGDALVRHLFAAGRAFEAVPYGTEALGVMRIEKGHPAGNELNGTTTAADLGMRRMMSKKKDYIGRVMAARPGLSDPLRPALVGLKPVDPTKKIRAGAHLLAPGAPRTAARDQGHVSSAAWSPTLGHGIALALLVDGPNRHGEHVVVHDPVRGADVEAEVCHPVFVDPEGVRVRA